MNDVITTEALAKHYGRVRAVDGLDLQVRRGEIYGFLGRNGAGKTTTIRMLLGLITPTSGTVRVFGEPIGADQEWLRRVGFLVESATAYPNLTVRENLELHRRLTGAAHPATETVIERLGLAEYADRRAGRLSLGNKQRLSLARALLHSPGLLILDEPANALDPAGIVEVRGLLRELADSGVTVFMSSHILAEVAHLADRIGIVHDGRLVEEASRHELAARARAYVQDSFTAAEREQALLTADLERYFLARTGDADPKEPVMFTQVLITEFAKLRRSSVPWVTLAVILFAPWAIALFMWIVRDPARAASLGLLGTKANLAGLEATWPAYSGYLAMIVGASGMLLLAFIVAYLFGREYLDQTAKNLLALPIRREWFALGKLTAAAVWWLILALAGLGEGLLIGRLLDLPGFSTQVLVSTVGNALLLAAISYALCPVVAWLTVATRNVLAAVGFALGMLLIGDLLSHTGWAVWFPWSIIPSVSGMSGSSGAALAPVSLIALLVVFALGVAGTAGQLRWADNP